MTRSGNHSLHEAVTALLPALEGLRIPYCLVGALAVGAWGLPRMTQDVDALLTIDEAHRNRLVGELELAGFRYDQAWADANPMVRERHLRFLRGAIPLDLMLPRDSHDRA